MAKAKIYGVQTVHTAPPWRGKWHPKKTRPRPREQAKRNLVADRLAAQKEEAPK